MPNNLIVTNEKKFVWDGVDYPNDENATQKMQKYIGDGFEVEVFEETAKKYLYTRRVVKEVIVQKSQ